MFVSCGCNHTLANTIHISEKFTTTYYNYYKFSQIRADLQFFVVISAALAILCNNVHNTFGRQSGQLAMYLYLLISVPQTTICQFLSCMNILITVVAFASRVRYRLVINLMIAMLIGCDVYLWNVQVQDR